jgi:hypothetical protein
LGHRVGGKWPAAQAVFEASLVVERRLLEMEPMRMCALLVGLPGVVCPVSASGRVGGGS